MCVLLAVALLEATAGATTSYALAPTLESNITAIAEHQARGGAVSVPGVNCGTTCTDLWLSEHRPIPNQPTSAALHRQLDGSLSRARIGSKVLPNLSTLGARAIPAIGALSIGWAVGTAANKKFLRIGIAQPNTAAPVTFTQPKWTFVDVGQSKGVVNGRLSPSPTATEPTAVLGVYVSPPGINQNSYTPECDNPANTPYWEGAGIAKQLPQTGGSCLAYGTATSITPAVRWRECPLIGCVVSDAPADYVAQSSDLATTSWAGTPTSQNDLETKTRTALDNDSMLRDWYLNQLDPENNPSPTEVTLTLPEPTPNELGTHYVTRLETLGFTNVDLSVVPDSAIDTSHGPDELLQVAPAPGTTLGSEANVNVRANPHNAPDATSGGGDWEAPTIRELDLSPLSQVTPSDTFPFGVFAYMLGVFGGWSGTGDCPEFSLPFTYGDLEYSFCPLEAPLHSIIHPMILLVAFLSFLGVLASSAMGVDPAQGD